MTDYISRQEALEPFMNNADDWVSYDVRKNIKRIPSADVRENVHGTWIGEGDGYSDGGIVYDTWYCSNCDHCEEGEYLALPNFCPDCGADMRGNADE